MFLFTFKVKCFSLRKDQISAMIYFTYRKHIETLHNRNISQSNEDKTCLSIIIIVSCKSSKSKQITFITSVFLSLFCRNTFY